MKKLGVEEEISHLFKFASDYPYDVDNFYIRVSDYHRDPSKVVLRVVLDRAGTMGWLGIFDAKSIFPED